MSDDLNLTDDERVIYCTPLVNLGFDDVETLFRTISDLRTQLAERDARLAEIDRHATRHQAEYDFVLSLCENPPEPNEKMKAMMKSYLDKGRRVP